MTDINTSIIPKKFWFRQLRPDVGKLDVDKVKTIPTRLSNLKSKVNKLDNVKLQAVLTDLKKLGDVVDNRVV